MLSNNFMKRMWRPKEQIVTLLTEYKVNILID